MQYQISFEFDLLPACAVLTLAWDQYILNCIKSLVQHHVNIIMRSSCFKTYDIHYLHYGCMGVGSFIYFSSGRCFPGPTLFPQLVAPAGSCSPLLRESSTYYPRRPLCRPGCRPGDEAGRGPPFGRQGRRH